jgi:hypothetical protein
MSAAKPQNTIVRIASSDANEMQELAKLLAENGIEPGPVTEVSPDEELLFDFGSLIPHMHEIMLVVEAYVVSGTLIHWINSRGRKKKVSDDVRKNEPTGAADQNEPGPSLMTININGHMVVVNEKTDLDKLRTKLEQLLKS